MISKKKKNNNNNNNSVCTEYRDREELELEAQKRIEKASHA